MNDPGLKEILLAVEKYIKNKQLAKKQWRPGQDWVHYAGPYYDSEEYKNAISTLLNGWLVLGKEGTKFERKFKKHFDKNHGILTNSGSSANLLMMLALTSKNLYNLPKGTKVLTPIAGFPTTINPIFQVGYEPVFVDIELETLNLDLNMVEDVLKKDPKIKAITFAHVLGNPPNMDRLMDLVKQYDLILLEDCCDALDSTYKGKPLGSFGDFASCSFYPAHHITMGEGGFVACNTLEQERTIRSFRDWGRGCYCVGEKASISACGACGKRFSNWLPSLPNQIFDHKYVYEEIGYNLKPIEIQAALGLTQLEKIKEIKNKRQKNFNLLREIFLEYEEHFHIPTATKHSDPNWFAFPLTVKDSSPVSRIEFTKFLEFRKIQTRTYFGGNVMLQPAYTHLADSQQVIRDFPTARKITSDTFFLGTAPTITEEQINYIRSCVKLFFDNRR